MSQEVLQAEPLAILVVENSRTARAVLQKGLTDAGYSVLTVATGPEAIEVLEKQPIKLIIMDIFMPLMNGYEVAKNIRLSTKTYALVPIIAYTASSNPRDEAQCIEAGMNAVIIKDKNNSALVSYISNAYF